MKKHAIYRLLEPGTFEVRYVGRTSNGLKRIRAHFIPSVLNKDKFPIDRWCKKHLSMGVEPSWDIAEEFEPCDDIDKKLNEAEIRWVAHHKEQGCSLLNCTPGGEGTIGWKHTAEAREAMRRAWEERRNHPVPDMARKRMSEAGKKRWAREVPAWGKAVMCIEDNVTFPTRAHAARHYGTHTTAIGRECDGSTFLKRTLGKSFKYV